MENRRLIALLDELKEQGHPLEVENVIYTALKDLRCKKGATPWEKIISGSIIENMDGNSDFRIMNQDKIDQFLKEG